MIQVQVPPLNFHFVPSLSLPSQTRQGGVQVRGIMSEERKRKTSQQDDSEDESERILEESPCGRWQKRGEEVSFWV